MKPILVLYATREGHSRRISEHLAATIRARSLAAEVVDAGHLPSPFSLGGYTAAMLVASVHLGKHEAEMTEFVKRYRADLERMPSAFLSVSLSEAGAEDPKAPPLQREQAAADVRRMMQEFLAETGWHPTETRAVAGALLYTKYTFLMRFVMKMIAMRAGGDTDTAHDYEYTDWEALDRLVDELLRVVPPEARVG